MEIDRYEDLHRNLKRFYNTRSGYFEEAHDVNSELTPERAHALSWIQAGDRVLDVGCGPGDNGRHLPAGVAYLGCDLSAVALEMAHLALPGQAFVASESQCLPFVTGSFDVVLSTYALEHLVFARQSLEEMWRVCRPGGLLLLISPAYDDPFDLPPSTSHWSFARRAQLMAQQALRQMRRHLNPGHFDFACVSRPRVLDDEYQSDFDAVHLVSAREVSNFVRSLGGHILFERKRQPRAVAGVSLGRHCANRVRNLLLRMHLGEYAGLNLQIIAAKGPRQLRDSSA